MPVERPQEPPCPAVSPGAARVWPQTRSWMSVSAATGLEAVAYTGQRVCRHRRDG